jgi:hypothetical protein
VQLLLLQDDERVDYRSKDLTGYSRIKIRVGSDDFDSSQHFMFSSLVHGSNQVAAFEFYNLTDNFSSFGQEQHNLPI